MPGSSFSITFDVNAPPAVVAGDATLWGAFSDVSLLPESLDTDAGVRDGDIAFVQGFNGSIIRVRNVTSAETWMAEDVTVFHPDDLTAAPIGPVDQIVDGATARIDSGGAIVSYTYDLGNEEWVPAETVPRLFFASDANFPDSNWPLRNGDAAFVFFEESEGGGGGVQASLWNDVWEIQFGVLLSEDDLVLPTTVATATDQSFLAVARDIDANAWDLYRWDTGDEDWVRVSADPAPPPSGLPGEATVWESVATPAELQSTDLRDGDIQATLSPNNVWIRQAVAWRVLLPGANSPFAEIFVGLFDTGSAGSSNRQSIA